MATEKFYLERDNTVDLILKEDDVAIDTSVLTQIKAIFNTVEIDSNDKASGLITWDQGGYDTGEIRLDCAKDATLVAQGAGIWDVAIVVYDGSNVSGIDWGAVRIDVVAIRGS